MTEAVSNIFKRLIGGIDWILVSAMLMLSLAGLVTMSSLGGNSIFFDRQIIWLAVSFGVFFTFSLIDFKFLRRTQVIMWIFVISVAVLGSLFFIGTISKGAQSWLNFGLFNVQPAEVVKLVLILLLAKYFSRRHVEIRNVKHIIVSGAYSFILFLLVLVQPDFGSAMIIFFIWFGMIMVSGLSKKHLLAVIVLGALAFLLMWTTMLQPYQKARIMTFLDPLQDIRGTGYNAYQSTIAVGSGEFVGKGVGYGTQSRLSFLPEYQTDFIFAAFAEEWGFIGVSILFLLFGIVIWRIIRNALHGATNFETLFGIGLAVLFMSHFIVHVGMNIGLLPVTGLTIPFMSYGGSHLVVTFAGLGILMSMRRYARAAHRDVMRNEFLGI
ncbi:MAG: rod shape-determining protein RodA [Candidatus Pacebacteria bacterium]|nr:rod shape-determining protein RodA [Candidatus Paceibacterota bacterium]